jgi:hypothetical protein
MSRLHGGTLVRLEPVSIGQTEVVGVSAGSSASRIVNLSAYQPRMSALGIRSRTTPQQSSARRFIRRIDHVSLALCNRTFAAPTSHRKNLLYLNTIFEPRLSCKEVVSSTHHVIQSDHQHLLDSHTFDISVDLVESSEKLHTTASRSERPTLCRQHPGLATPRNARIPTLAGAQRAVRTAELCHCARPDHRHHS